MHLLKLPCALPYAGLLDGAKGRGCSRNSAGAGGGSTRVQDAPGSWLYRPAAQLGRSLVRQPANTEAERILQPAGRAEEDGARRQDTGYAHLTVALLRFTHLVQVLMRTSIVRGKLQRFRCGAPLDPALRVLHVLDTNRLSPTAVATQSARVGAAHVIYQHTQAFTKRGSH